MFLLFVVAKVVFRKKGKFVLKKTTHMYVCTSLFVMECLVCIYLEVWLIIISTLSVKSKDVIKKTFAF